MSDRLEDIISFRRKKLENLRAAGMDPYPSSTARTHTNKEALEQYLLLQGKPVTLVGRVRSLRTMGKLIFAHIEDGTARIQVLLKSDSLGEEKFKFFEDNFDIGDFAEFTGTLFTTKSEEKTLEVSDYRMLAKSLLPLPGEHYGLEDEEQRLRKRHLDILLNADAKQLFVLKDKFWQAMRSFLIQHGFLEMQMPILEPIPGGAEAEPFVTHYNALDRDFFLRISLELPLKRMLVAGYEKVFEIGRIFRNEGIDREHLQDYTQMEFYWAYGDFEKLMQFSQEMYQHVIRETLGTLKTNYRGAEIDWSGDWPKQDYFELFKKYTGLDLLVVSDEDLRQFADSKHISYEPSAGRGRLIDLIFKKTVRILPEVFTQPSFLVNQPIELEPLAKKDSANPKIVQRMQIMVGGSEMGKGFGELNDPIDQRERFDAQMKLREAGDGEAQMLDEDYLEAMEYGMPPAAGFGLSERFFAALMDRSIRETTVFPSMKDESGNNTSKHGKSKETKIAVALLSKEAKLEPWQELNTIAHLTAALGVRQGKALMLQDQITTSDKENLKLNIQHAIMIKVAPSNEAILSTRKRAKEAGLEIADFTREMIVTTSDKKVIEMTASKKANEIEHLGLLVFGEKPVIEALTKDYPLYS